ncbi:MAG: FG-GAP-like repeat-containing protein [Planctomycetota bacterium]
MRRRTGAAWLGTNHWGAHAGRLTVGLGLVAACFATVPELRAQDEQPGRNFVASANFGGDRSEAIAAGDIDLDGDMDVLVANGSDGAAQPNRIYINLGPGSVGTFSEQTSTRLAGAPIERSRDVEFVDFDGDGDLDFLDVCEDATSSIGAVQRFYTNLGGMQGGSIGFYSQSSNTNWGTLVSVPVGDQVFGGNQGPWRGFGQDADFADLDLDGDLDLFWSTAGPSLNGTRDSRVFLNSGSAVFNELWPWANASADIQMHAMESVIADLDGDLDLDIVCSSRGSQARVFTNNLNAPASGSPFQDVTQTAFISTGATWGGAPNEHVELIDVDLDTDFDLWMTNYGALPGIDRLLENQSAIVAGASHPAFVIQPTWINSDPNVVERATVVIDYDNDHDLDMVVANPGSHNWIYRSNLSQGGPGPSPRYFRTGFGGEFPETPSVLNTGTNLDVAVADFDKDGDDEIAVARGNNEQNRLYNNALLPDFPVPSTADTESPIFAQVEQVANRPLGPPARVIAQVRDAHAMELVSQYPTVLWWNVDGGAFSSVAMAMQAGQQFMGHIPGNVQGFMSYFIECTDFAGNIGISSLHSYQQGPVSNPWTNLGFSLAGVNGAPVLVGIGPLAAGSAGSLTLSSSARSALCILFVGGGVGATPFKQGTFVPTPVLFQLPLVTTAGGTLPLAWAAWPAGLPTGTVLSFQYWITDGAAPAGFSASNALRAVMP